MIERLGKLIDYIDTEWYNRLVTISALLALFMVVCLICFTAVIAAWNLLRILS